MNLSTHFIYNAPQSSVNEIMSAACVDFYVTPSSPPIVRWRVRIVYVNKLIFQHMANPK